MKRILFLLLIGSNSITFAQLQVQTLNLTVNDLVYDSVTNKIYASIPSANGANGNSIGVINPVTKTLENTVFIGSEPSVLAISDNGQYVYAGFTGTSTIRRFDVANQTAGLQFSLGSDPFFGSFYAQDIEVMPGSPNTIAVSRRRPNVSPTHGGVAIYDDSVMRPTTTPDHTGSNVFEFTSATTLVGYNTESTEYGLRRLSVNAGGVSNSSVNAGVLTGFGLDFVYKNNTLYATNGTVVDMSSAPFVSGQFSNVSGPVVYDDYYNRVCYASYDWNGNITFKRFNPTTFLLFDSLSITQAFGNVKNIITCGNGCYAFNTTDNKVVIINDSTLGLSDNDSRSKLSLYPNPTSDFLNIKSDIALKEVNISDLNGRVLNNVNFTEDRIYLGDLSSGIYLVMITDIQGNRTTEKIIKK
ncbi:T9SS type A sorting domain-containing protein [Flavobacterium dankookense]|uniref:Putative secreted protein (Por secretion system target) n=1 Tax=Flavobacterium dankookense TaxID=706186 RepID=A0A4R6QB05_9FLAO|nr:T9SS type A sorting domain-containing protein [Flavobacterium dankookense]TDP59380.1 putative secreted protein (Por secretion system target) [Flavobacterium dankookense]